LSVKLLSTKKRFGATPAKLALVAVLAVVQLAVIVRAVWHRSEVVAIAAPSAESTPATTSTPAATPGPTNEARDATRWPVASLEEALAFDPFQKPQWLMEITAATESAIANPSESLQQLKQEGASIVVLSDDGKAATIGDQQFRIGDVIDGYQVTDITIHGVEFTRLPTP
jgi:hypothetical protein